MSWLKNFFSSIDDAAKSRVNNPFYGAFIFSWLIFNWKIILILLFSKKNIYSVIEDITNHLNANLLLYYPLLASLILLILIPIATAIYSYFDALIRHIILKSNSTTKFIESFFKKRSLIALKKHKHKIKIINLAHLREKAFLNDEIAKHNRNAAFNDSEVTDLAELKDELMKCRNYHMLLKEQMGLLSNSMGKLGNSINTEPFKTAYYQNQEDGPIRHLPRAQQLLKDMVDTLNVIQEKEGWKDPS